MASVEFNILSNAQQVMAQVERSVVNSTRNMTSAERQYATAVAQTQGKIVSLRMEAVNASRDRQREIKNEIAALRTLEQANRRAQSASRGPSSGGGSGGMGGMLGNLAGRIGGGSGGIGGMIGGIGGAGMAAAGAGIAIAAVVKFSKAVVESGMEFQKQVSVIRAITDGNEALTQSLARQSREVGAASSFSISEVAKLQVTLLKFGFTGEEVMKSTEAVVKLAEATNISLDQASTVAAETLRGFSLDASQMQRVIDVMGNSFNKTALDVSTYQEAMKYVGPVAKDAGLSIERTSAMLGKLADNGIKGSMAGTSLRRIITDASIKASKEGITFNEAFDSMARSGLTVSDAFDEVGRTAQTALSILSNNKVAIDALTVSFENSAGSIKKMSDIMRDNLAGDISKVGAAWDAFKISVFEGNGWISNSLRTLTQDFAALLHELTVFSDNWGDLTSNFTIENLVRFKLGIDKSIERTPTQSLSPKELRLNEYTQNLIGGTGYKKTDNTISPKTQIGLPVQYELNKMTPSQYKAAEEQKLKDKANAEQSAKDESNRRLNALGNFKDNTTSKLQFLIEEKLPKLTGKNVEKFNELKNNITDLTSEYTKASDIERKTIELKVGKRFSSIESLGGRGRGEGQLNDGTSLAENRVVRSLTLNIAQVNGQYIENNYAKQDPDKISKNITIAIARETADSNAQFANS